MEDASGNLILAGSTEYRGEGNIDVYALKVDPDGNEIWNRTYGTKSREMAFSSVATPDEGCIIAGYRRRFALRSFVAPENPDIKWGGWTPSGEEILLMKIDGDGDVVWRKCYGGKYDRRAHSIIPSADEEYLLAGLNGGIGGTVSIDPGCNAHVMRIRDERWSLLPWYSPYLVLAAFAFLVRKMHLMDSLKSEEEA